MSRPVAAAGLPLSLAVVALVPAAAVAADPAAVFAAQGYWSGFVDFWAGSLQKQNGVVLTALGVGALSLFIITRGKWIK